METDINKIYEMLDWNNDVEIQKKGIELAKDIENLSLFLQPNTGKYNKNVWENCAQIIYNSSDERIQPYLYQMLEWLQDMNWPGALIIAKRLNNYNEKNEIEENISRIISNYRDDKIFMETIKNLFFKNI